MDRKKRNIKKDMLKRKYFIKNEIKRILLKSVIQDRCTNKLAKGLALYKISQFKSYSSISRQNNICLKTGRYGGSLKNTFFSRHYVKNLAKQGELQNFRIASW